MVDSGLHNDFVPSTPLERITSYDVKYITNRNPSTGSRSSPERIRPRLFERVSRSSRSRRFSRRDRSSCSRAADVSPPLPPTASRSACATQFLSRRLELCREFHRRSTGLHQLGSAAGSSRLCNRRLLKRKCSGVHGSGSTSGNRKVAQLHRWPARTPARVRRRTKRRYRVGCVSI
jgi:hypothetical protein